jgi:putative ATPase
MPGSCSADQRWVERLYSWWTRYTGKWLGTIPLQRLHMDMLTMRSRFNKSQQDLFLPYVENGWVQLIGATTENPSFKVNGALLSRCQ